ncbi:WD40 repeat domain-containing protein [Streptomyces chartreusis]|uniref:WD40 repeat domain-containing protein n=1 Tax=Streptomyces chartreusis TaxID=1969 RepID=UPI00365B14FF
MHPSNRPPHPHPQLQSDRGAGPDPRQEARDDHDGPADDSPRWICEQPWVPDFEQAIRELLRTTQRITMTQPSRELLRGVMCPSWAGTWTAPGDKELTLTATGTPHHLLEGHTSAVTALCTVELSGGLTLASASADSYGTVRLWDPATRSSEHLLEGRTGTVGALCTVRLSDGRTLLASASDDHTGRLWDPTTIGRGSASSPHHAVNVRALCAVELSEGRTLLASAGAHGVVQLWDPPPASHNTASKATPRRSARSARYGFPASTLCSPPLSADGVVRLWDPTSGTPRHRLKGHMHRTRSSQAGPGRASSSSARARPI